MAFLSRRAVLSFLLSPGPVAPAIFLSLPYLNFEFRVEQLNSNGITLSRIRCETFVILK